MKSIITFLFFAVATSSFGQFWSATGAAGTAGESYLVAATSIGNHVYAFGNNSNLVHSSDKGVTWEAITNVPLSGACQTLTACNNYLYAAMQINTYDHELHYSLDHGITWNIDTIGLPQNIVNTGKAAMNLRYMGNNYIVAFSPTESYYKNLGASTWTKTNIDYTIPDVVGMNDNWYAVGGGGRIYKSTNHGGSWAELPLTGLPADFQGNKLASNGVDRLYISNSPANGGTDIYISTDGGNSFTLTNAAGHHAHANPWVGAMFAVDDYIFASILPESMNFNDAPPYIMSSASTPNFSAGDVSGLPTGSTVTGLPFFFNSGDKLFTMFGDIYTSTPGFEGKPITVSINEQKALEVGIYPNPAQHQINISFKEMESLKSIELYSIQGQLIKAFNPQTKTLNVSNIPRGQYILKIQSTINFTSKKVILN